MESLGRRWKKVPTSVRKPLILVVGSLVIIGGIILLPLPGPGWVIIFAGFALLATEYEQAELVRDWLIHVFKLGAFYLKKAWYKLRGQAPPAGSPPRFAKPAKSKH
jgi:uncharacterized protein (TIGR02611 family)